MATSRLKVEAGVEHQRAGRLVEAIDSYTDALHIAPANLEGLVARGSAVCTL